MINLDRLKAAGLTKEKLKSYFSDPKPETPARKLLDEIRDEIKDGVSRNLKDYRIYWAIDRAFDTPFYQLSYTKLKGLLSRKAESKEILKQVKDWGLVHLLPNEVGPDGKVCCESGTTTPRKSLSLPVFFDVELPLVLAYLTIRWAKLFNDRNLVPLYKYEPLKFNKKNRLRCEIVTELIQIMSTQYDYPSDEAQAILQTLMYGICLKFPREAWHKKEQEDENGKAVVVKQGLRFNMPHPSRLYYDLYSRLSTINSDSGIKYAGYWEIARYNDIKNNKDYWNKDKVTFGAVGWFNGFSDFFSTVYPCTIKFPAVNDAAPVAGSGSALDRESEAAFYGASEANSATLLTQHFKEIIPKERGLGTYEYPVWLRLVVGNGETVHWAEPTGFTPAAYYGYDADQNRARHSSLALEVQPFQDICSQITTQWIYSMRQNLMNPTFVNTDLVDQHIIDQLENTGERALRGKTFIPYSKTKNIRQQIDHTDNAFESPQLTRHNTSEQAALLRGIIDLLDRMLVLSSQEIAQSAPHEQTAEEIRTINATTSTRLDFTGSFIDRGIFATKKMVYEAYMVHGEDDFVAQISSDYADTEAEFKKILDDLDLELDEDEDDGPSKTTTRRTVKGKKKSLALELFASTRDAANRIDNPGIAAAMSQIFTAIARNEVLIAALGPEQLVSLLNQIVQVAGLPKEFQLKATANNGQPGQQQIKELQDQLLQFAEQVKKLNDQTAKQVMTEVEETVTPMAQTIQQLVQGLQQLAEKDAAQDQQLQQVAQAVGQLTEALTAIAQPQPQPAMPEYDPSQEIAPVGI